MAIYQAIRTSPYNNWQYRLDIMPHDESLDGSIVALDEGSVVQFGDLEYGFDDVIPYGLAGPATWSVTLNFSRLPTALQGYLREKYKSYSNIVFGTYDAHNTFMYWTDSGSNGSTWTLLFVGVVENTESVEYEPNESGELQTTYNLVDGAYHAMLDLTGNMAGIVPSTSHVQTGGLIYDYYAITGRSQWRNDYGSEGNAIPATAHFKRWDEFCDDVQSRISAWVWLTCTRFDVGTFPNTAYSTNFDYNQRLRDLINTGARFKGYNTDGSGDAFADIGDGSAFVLQYIVADGAKIGGLYSLNDEYSLSQAQCVKDQISDLCETFCVKLYWKPEYVTDVAGDYIRWNVEVATLLGNKRLNGLASVYDLDGAVSLGTLREGAGVIGKAEQRVVLEGDQKNVTEHVTTAARSRSERSINFEPVLHNCPTPKNRLTSRFLAGINYPQRESIGIDQTNLIFTNDGAFSWGGLSYGYAKVHHDTRIVVRGAADGGTATTYYDSTSSAKPVSADEPEHIAWMNTIQRNACLPKALSKATFETFSGTLQCEQEIEWITDSSTLIDQLGAVHELQNGLASMLTQHSYDQACVVRVVQSFESGTSQITYFLPSV